jgi:hypothetical protein
VRAAPLPLVALALAAGAAAAGGATVRSAAVHAYEVYTQLTVGLNEPTTFTCEAGAEPHTLVLTVAAEVRGDVVPLPAGRIEEARLARAKGATTFILRTAADAGTFRAYLQRDPPAVVVDVFRRLDLTPRRREPAFVKILGGGPVLLVDDDDGPGNGNQYSVDVDAKYTAALERLRVPYEVYVVRAGRDGPAADRLAPYSLVVWFNGLDARPKVISAADEAAMAAYVAGGGRLWLVSQNYLSDASRGRTAFCRETLGITSYKADTQVEEVAVAETVTLPRLAYRLSNDLTIIGNWGDGFDLPAGAEALFVGPDDGRCYGMVRAAGGGRVAFFSFAVENVGYPSRLADIVEATFDALAEG